MIFSLQYFFVISVLFYFSSISIYWSFFTNSLIIIVFFLFFLQYIFFLSLFLSLFSHKFSFTNFLSLFSPFFYFFLSFPSFSFPFSSHFFSLILPVSYRILSRSFYPPPYPVVVASIFRSCWRVYLILTEPGILSARRKYPAKDSPASYSGILRF